jgi:short-subunit dehydrogenase
VSDALRRELLLYGIDVIVIEPGSIRAPIWDKAEQEDISPYLQTD